MTTTYLAAVTLRPSNVQASLGLEQCMSALEESKVTDTDMVQIHNLTGFLQGTWTSAARAWELLHGFQRGTENVHFTHAQGSGGHKRPADDAFGIEKSSDYLQREAFGGSQFDAAPKSENGVQELGTRIMAHMLGLDIPGVEASTSYYPGYEWWPRPNQVVQQPLSPMQGQVNSMSIPQTPEAMQVQANTGWLQGATGGNAGSTMNFSYDFSRFGA